MERILMTRRARAIGLPRGASKLGASAALFAILCTASAAESAPVISLYMGDVPNVEAVVPWGSGTIEAVKQPNLEGNYSLKITSQGLYQGAAISLPAPVDLGPYAANKDAFLQVAVNIPSLSAGREQGTSGGTGLPGFRPPSGGTGYTPFPGSSTGSKTARKAPPVQFIRVVLVTVSNRTMEAMLPVAYAATNGAWRTLSIPLVKLTQAAGDDLRVKQLRIFADSPATVYLGRAAIFVDATPISIDPIDEKVVPRKESYTYTAAADGGLTPLRIVWNFDTAAGDHDEAEGRTITRSFTKQPGDYKVTVTAKDYYGVKAPARTTFNVHVTP